MKHRHQPIDATPELLMMVEEFLNEKGLKKDFGSYFVAPITKERESFTVTKRRFRLWCQLRLDPRNGILMKPLEDAFDEYCYLAQKDMIKEFAKNIAYVGPNTSIDVWLQGVVGFNAEVNPLHKVIIRHFIWQVKRKMLGLDVDYHLMPVIFGPQGAGKTRAIERFLEPITKLVLRGKAVNFMDDVRELNVLEENYVCFFDEMSRADQVNTENLKGKMSARTVKCRVFNTLTYVDVEQNCTFIGAANKSLIDLIYDTTGMRRFWQIDGAQTKIQEERERNWALIGGVNALDMWRSVDEAQDIPEIVKYWSEISGVQEGFRATSSIEDFLDTTDIKPAEEGVNPIPLAKLYNQYKDYCIEAKLDAVQLKRFARTLRNEHGFKSGRSNVGVTVFISKVLTNSGVLEITKKRI